MKYSMTGSDVFLMDESDIIVLDKLEPKTYVVKFNEQRGIFYLTVVDDMSVPIKVYGKCIDHSERIISTFLKRHEQTGVHLTGEKGSGKTLLAKVISEKLRDLGMATIIVNDNFCGEAFNTFVASIGDPCLFLFDEYEKIYNSEEQQKMLTLFDGTRNSKKLFIVTSNNSYAVDQCMTNRPGRFFYKIKYAGLHIDFVTEYLDDCLKNKNNMESVILLVNIIGAEFNFDMLKAIVEEMNRYNETAQEAVDILNIELTGGNATYKILELVSTKSKLVSYNKTVDLDVFKRFYFEYQTYSSAAKQKQGDCEWESINFLPDDIVSVKGDFITLENDEGKLVLRKLSFEDVDFRRMF